MTLIATPKWSQQRLTRGSANGQWSATLGWSVIGPVSELSDDNFCTTAPGIPSIDDPHPVNPLMTVETIAAQPGLTERMVLATYSIPGGYAFPKPVYDPVPYVRNLPIDQDAKKNPIVNTAGFPLPNRLNGDDVCLQLNLTISQPYYDMVASLALMDQINSQPYTLKTGGTLAPGQAIINMIRPTSGITVGQPFVNVLYTILCCREGWNKTRTLNCGYIGWGKDASDSDPQPYPFCDHAGHQLSDPVLLDATGIPLLDSIYVLTASGPQTPVYPPNGTYLPDNSLIDSSNPNAVYINFDTTDGSVDFNTALPF